jgi:hypothetical protein
VTALVTLPPAVLEQSTISVEAEAPVAVEAESAFAPEPTIDEVATTAPEPIEAPDDEPASIEWIPDAPAPSTLAGAVPEGAAFDAGLAALIGDESAPTSNGASAESTSSAAGPSAYIQAPESQGVESQPEPVRTSAGLVKRVPRAATSTADAPERPSNDAPVARTQRSPEEVRAMLSRYRSGLHRGRDGESTNGSSNDGTD